MSEGITCLHNHQPYAICLYYQSKPFIATVLQLDQAVDCNYDNHSVVRKNTLCFSSVVVQAVFKSLQNIL